nr:MAG TPA: hypothetical protein [Caudoviricetes sp.]
MFNLIRTSPFFFLRIGVTEKNVKLEKEKAQKKGG